MMKFKKVLASMLIVSLILSGIMVLTACNKDDETKDSTAAATETPTATEAQTEVQTQPQTATDAPADHNDSQPVTEPADQPDSAAEDSDGYINKADAIVAVKQQAGSGATILDVHKGYSPDGLKAWVITVSPITSSDEPVTVTYYAGYQFCYPAESSDGDEGDSAEDDGYIDRADAIAAVKQQAGSGATILDVHKGYSPDGLKAWVITVSPITSSDEPVTVTYYAGYQFCYAE